MKKHNIFVSANVKKFYSFNSKNKKSIIVIEIINVVDDYFTFLVLIVQNQQIIKF